MCLSLENSSKIQSGKSSSILLPILTFSLVLSLRAYVSISFASRGKGRPREAKEMETSARRISRSVHLCAFFLTTFF